VTFTYDVFALTTNLAKVRKRIGDVRRGLHFLEDEEIQEVIDRNNNDLALSSLGCAKEMLARVVRNVSASGGGVTTNPEVMVQHVKELIAELEKDAMGATGLTLTGASLSEESDRASDSDKKPLPFQVGMDRYPGLE